MLPYDIVEIGGNCPVQAEGTVEDKPFYFRARGNSWSMGIGGDPISAPEWSMSRAYGVGDPFSAGWMTTSEARAFIEEAVLLYERQAKMPQENVDAYLEDYGKGQSAHLIGKKVPTNASPGFLQGWKDMDAIKSAAKIMAARFGSTTEDLKYPDPSPAPSPPEEPGS